MVVMKPHEEDWIGRLEHAVPVARVPVSHASHREQAAMNGHEVEVRQRIASLVDSVQDDRDRSQDLFQYVWAMMCVRRGLLRVVREVSTGSRHQLLLEEVRTGRQRVVVRPPELDGEIESLAVQAFAHIIGEIPASS